MPRSAPVAGALLKVKKLAPPARGARRQQTTQERALNTILSVISDADHFDLQGASDLVKAVLLQDPELEGKLVRIPRGGTMSPDEVIRLIRIFELTCSKPQLLDHLLRLESLENSRIRSKVVLTIGRLVQNANWLREQLQNPDPRARANAIEALWEVRVEGAEELMLKAALDSSNRVIGNAAYGLYKLDNPKSIPILYSLLRQSHRPFRKTGLWVVTQLGDPRFLEAVGKSPVDGAEDEDEAALRESARQRFEGRLQSSRFAGKVDLHLSSFTISGHKTRLAALRCLSSDLDIALGPPELSKLSFVIEEGERQIEEFECRWIAPVEKASLVIIVPAGLSIRSQPLRMLAEKAMMGDAVTVLRYLPSSSSAVRDVRSWLAENQVTNLSNSFNSQSFPISDSFYESLLQGWEKLHYSSGPRYMFCVADGSAEGKMPADLQKTARGSDVMLHALVSPDVNDELAQTLSALSLKSGGSFLRSNSAEALPAIVRSIQARHAGSSCELSWTGFEKNPADIRIQCVSGCGYGEVTIAKQEK